MKIDLKGLDEKTVEKVGSPEYFKSAEGKKDKKSEEAFFKQGEKPEVRSDPGVFVLACADNV